MLEVLSRLLNITATEALPTASVTWGTVSTARAETMLREVASWSRESSSKRQFSLKFQRAGQMDSSGLLTCWSVCSVDGREVPSASMGMDECVMKLETLKDSKGPQ